MNPEMNSGTSIPSISKTEEQLGDAARKIDNARHDQDNKNPVDQVIAGTGVDSAAGQEAEPQADAMIAGTITFLVSMGTDVMNVRYQFKKPTDEWKAEVGRLSALLIDKYFPSFLADNGLEASLLLMVATYAFENIDKFGNLAGRKPGRSDSDTRQPGQRKDDFVEQAPPVSTEGVLTIT